MLLIFSCWGIFFGIVFAETPPPTQAAAQNLPKDPQINFLLRDTFYLPPLLKLKYNTYESNGLLLIKESRPDLNSDYAAVTGFDNSILETQALKNVHTPEDAQALFSRSSKTSNFMGVTIKELSIEATDGVVVPYHWIGEKSFPSKELAEANIVSVKTAIESGGGNFERAIKLIDEFAPSAPKAPSAEEARANFEREEKFAVKVMDYLDIGEKLYGPLHTPTSPYGEPILWQSFGETSFRFTNLEHDEYYAQVGFWTNRFVFKGLRWLFDTTLDPYVEVTPVLESNGVDFKSHMKLIGGIEWYPLIRNAALQNYRPWGIPFFDFARNYRLFVQYMFRENLKDEITGSKDTDLWAGADIFYEWGLALPPLGAKPVRSGLSDYVHDFVWGEYFGTYHFELTDFSSIEMYQSWILNSSVTLGIKWPAISLPHNGVNDELTFMPYLRFEHVTNPNHPLFYQNYYFAAAGLRLMPFRSYQFSENEWLYKTKLFVEYIGLGSTLRPSANTPPDTPSRDLRFGIAFSYRRF